MRNASRDMCNALDGSVEEKFGQEIRLTNERWQHIQERHPEVKSHLSKIKSTLENPDIIIDNLYNQTEKYYHKYLESLENYLIVIVQLEKKFVITAFISRRPKKGKISWTKD